MTDGFQKIDPIDVTVTITGHSNTATYDGEMHQVSVTGLPESFSFRIRVSKEDPEWPGTFFIDLDETAVSLKLR